jgi:hypothetical protein
MAESGLRIDSKSGEITLPNGLGFGAALTRSDLAANDWPAQPKATVPLNAGWASYSLAGGSIEWHPLHVGLVFRGQVLALANLGVWLYASDLGLRFPQWDTETAAKRLHDRLLVRALGNPTKVYRVAGRGEPEPLTNACAWGFRWGVVSSVYDAEAGRAQIRVQYERRLGLLG